MGRVEGKVAFITGAARGQGRAHAVRLASEGAHIIAVDLCEDIATNNYPLARPEDLAETVRLVEEHDRRIVATPADVRDPKALQAAVDAGVAELGRLDVVVANAGICPLGANVPFAAFNDVMEVNFNGVVHAVSAAMPHLHAGASIICTGSLAAFLGGTVQNPASGPGGAGYSLAKQFIAQYVNTLAATLAPHKIRVNAVHPTNCNTDMLHSEPMYRIFRPDLESPTREDVVIAFPAMSAMGEPWVEPEDVANAVLFLASDESRFVTGMQLRVDSGGYLPSHATMLSL